MPNLDHKPVVTQLDQVIRSPDLDQVEHFEAARSQQPDPIAVPEVELDAARRRPSRTDASRSMAAMSRSAAGPSSFVSGTVSAQNVPLPRKTSSPPGRRMRAASRDPAGRIGPDGGAVLADGQIEGGIGQAAVLGVAVDQREVQVVLVLEASRRLQLLGGVVDPGDAGTAGASQAPK